MTRFAQAVSLVVLVYVALQLVYLQRLPLIMDEFDGAYDVYRLRHDIPYRDFTPYKTVLGYYLQLPATFFASSVWGRLLALKIELIVINAGMMVAAAFYCARFMRPTAVAGALALLAASTPMMERAAEIRVDMLTGWAGLWGLLFLLRRRYALSGLCLAAGFAISQKAALYVIATAAVFLAAMLIAELRRQAFRGAIVCAGAAAGGVAIYVALWSMAADPVVVLRSTFLAASQVALSAAYDIQWRFWSQTLLRNFMIFVLSAAAPWSLFRLRGQWHRGAVVVYSAVLIAQCAMYTQPWPYFFVTLFPTLFVLIAAFIDVVEEQGSSRRILAACVLVGVLFPLHRLFVLLRHDSDYQRYNVTLASALLERDDTYLAFNDILHDREQTLGRLARLDAIGLHMLSTEGPDSHARIVRALDREPPKLIIGTSRMAHLPPLLQAYIAQSYERLSGSIWLYAPLVQSGQQSVDVRFPGRYRVELNGGATTSINGRPVPDGAMLELPRARLVIEAPSALRLRFLPEGLEELVDPRFAGRRSFYPRLYE